MSAEPRAAPSTNGNPCTAPAVSEMSETACAATTTSPTTSTRLRTANAHAIRGSTSTTCLGRQGPRRDDDAQPRALPGDRRDLQRASRGVHSVPDVGQAGAGPHLRRVEADPVVADRQD